MKKLYLLLFLLILFKILPAQQNTFKESFAIGGLQDYDYKIKILPGDRSILIGKTSYNSAGYNAVHIVILNKDGSQFFSKLFTNKFYSVNISDVIQTKDSGFLLVGDYGLLTGESSIDLLVIKIDKKGKQQWAKGYKSNQQFQFLNSSVVEDKNAGFVIASNIYNTSITSAPITKLDLDGNVLWSNVIQFQLIAPYDKLEGTSLVQTDDGFYFIGSFFDEFFDIWKNWGAIIKISETGKIVYVKGLDVPNIDIFKSVTISNVIKRNSNLYFLGSFTSTSESNNVDTLAYLFLKYNSQSVIQQSTIILSHSKKIQNLNFDKKLFNLQAWLKSNDNLLPLEYNNSAGFYKDGGFANTWKIVDEKQVSDFYIKKFDSLGRICPNFALPNVDTLTLQKTYLTSNVSHSVSKHSFVVKNLIFTDSSVIQQNIICSGIVPSEEVSDQAYVHSQNKLAATIFPNPAKNDFILSYQANKATEAYINIYSLQGKSVMFKKIIFNKGSNTQLINIQTLTKGIYFIKLQDGMNENILKLVKN